MAPHCLHHHPSQIFVSHDRKLLSHTFQASTPDCFSDRHLWATIQIFDNRHFYIIQISLHAYLSTTLESDHHASLCSHQPTTSTVIVFLPLVVIVSYL